MTAAAIPTTATAAQSVNADATRSRRWTVALLAVAAIALAVGVAVLDRFPVGAFHDDAMYVILGKALATGHGYRYLNLPGAPIASHFPPGYPALLALVWRIAPAFPANVVVFKLLNAVFLSATGVLIAQLVRDRLGTGSERWAVGLGIISAVSVPLLVLVTMVLSEPFFLAFLLALLIVAERLVSAPVALGRALTLGCLVGALTLVRSHGIVLLPAILLALVGRGRWRESSLVITGTGVVLLPWLLWSAASAGALPAPLEGNYGSYVGWWIRGVREMGPSMIPATLGRTAPEAATMMATLFSPSRGASAHGVTLAALAALLAAGVVALRSRAPVTLLFLAGYIAIVLVWPFSPSRFVWGVWPLLLFVFAAAGWRLAEADGSPSRVLRAALAVALVWVSAGYAAYELRAARGAWWRSIPRAGSQRIEPAVAWTLANTMPSDVVASDDEGAMYLYTGRRAVPVASFTTAHYLRDRSAKIEAIEGLVPILAAYPVRAVLVGSKRTFDAAQYLASSPLALLALREQFTGGSVFTVLPR